MRRSLVLSVLLVSGAVSSRDARADDVSHIYGERVRPFLEEHCFRCHGADRQRGDLRLDTLAPDLAAREAAAAWVEVMNRVNLGEMPPEDEPRPDAGRAREVTAWVASELRRVERERLSTGGRVLLRRLNRTEYANTIRDVLGVTFFPGEGPLTTLPPDGTAEGFDKVSTALMLDPSLLERYYEVAVGVAERAIVEGPPEFPTELLRFEFEDTDESIGIGYLCSKPGFVCREDDIVLIEGETRSYAELKYPGTKRHIATKGLYRVRVRAAADPGASDEPVVMRVTQSHPEESQEEVLEVEVTAPPDAPEIYEVIVPRDPSGGEWHVRIVPGSKFRLYNRPRGDLNRAIEEAGLAQDYARVMRLRGRVLSEAVSQSRPNPETVDIEKLPRLFLDWIEVEGPLYDQWPPRSHEIVMSGGEGEARTAERAREIFARLLPRLWRRPVAAEEVEPIAGLVGGELAEGASFEEAVRVGLTAALTSPKFLYLFEPSDAEDGPRELSPWELASRLSYFLWSSAPDDVLYGLAESAALGGEETLLAQVERMLADERAEALVHGFAAQWLRTDEFRSFTPDPDLYRGYDDDLGASMVAEAHAFFREVLEREASVREFLDSDWTMLDERLARHYGIEGVRGDALRRVTLPDDSPRGGLLGMAGLAMRGSDGVRTKPVNRGAWVREALLGDPPDPPPPNAGEVEPNIQGERLTVRERLIRHQEIETCAACHRGIDPYGLALENFNVIGAWRERQDGEDFRGSRRPEIDASGTLPDGRAFADFEEFKRLLAGDAERFVRALTAKLMVYAVGRPLEPSDRTTIDTIVERARGRDWTLRSLIEGVVTSRAFLTK